MHVAVAAVYFNFHVAAASVWGRINLVQVLQYFVLGVILRVLCALCWCVSYLY